MSFLKNKNYRSLAPILLLVVLVFLYLLYLEAHEPNYFLYGDNAKLFLPAYSHSWRAVTEYKTIPLINFHQFLGHTFLASGQTGVLYLPVYISLLLSKITTGNIFYGIDVLAFMHLIVSGIGMFLLLRRFCLSSAVCFLASLMWVTMPFVITSSRSWISFSYTAAYLPFNFLLLDWLIVQPRVRNALYLAILKSAFFYQGHVQLVFMMVGFEFIYLILLSGYRVLPPYWVGVGQLRFRFNIVFNNYWGYLKIFLKMYLSSTFFFFCMIAPLLIPMVFQQKESALRSAKLPFAKFINHAILWRDFIMAQFFYFQKNIIWRVGSEILYFGLVNLLLLSLVLVKKLRPNYRISVFIVIAGIALIFSTRFYAAFYYIPGINFFRWPFKYYIFFLFFATIGVAGVSNELIQQKTKWVKIGTYLLLTLAIGLNCLVLRHKPENVTSLNRIGIPPKNYVDKFISNKAGRIFTFWVNDIRPQEFYKYFPFSFATLFNYFHFGGYDTLVSKQNYELSLHLNHTNMYSGPISQNLLDYLSLWSVRYLVTSDNLENRIKLSHFPQLVPKYERHNILLYENTLSLPLVYYQNNRHEGLEFNFGINEINIYPKNNSERILVINVAPLPRFQIFVNGIYSGNVNPREVPIRVNLPPKTKQVTIKYVDYTFYAGILVFVLFWVCLLCFLIITKLKKDRNRAAS